MVQLRGENAVIDAGGQIDVVLNRVSVVFVFLRLIFVFVHVDCVKRWRERGRG